MILFFNLVLFSEKSPSRLLSISDHAQNQLTDHRLNNNGSSNASMNHGPLPRNAVGRHISDRSDLACECHVNRSCWTGPSVCVNSSDRRDPSQGPEMEYSACYPAAHVYYRNSSDLPCSSFLNADQKVRRKNALTHRAGFEARCPAVPAKADPLPR